MPDKTSQLISYIAPSAPATRQRSQGNEPFLRPEIGFTPRWYREKLQIDFGHQWHENVQYRRETVIKMRKELCHRFPGTEIGGIHHPDEPLDLLTGVYGTTVVAAIYGVPIIYAKDNWPNCEHYYLTNEQVDKLEPPNLETNAFFQNLMAQIDWITDSEGRVEGFINWQGVLNNAYRLRGEQLFIDIMTNLKRCQLLFNCICTTMIEAAKRVHQRQHQSGVEVDFFTVSNCLVNMVSPQQYRKLLLPLDNRIAQEFGCIGVHNCAWNANPYMKDYAKIPKLAYIDMGLESDLKLAKQLFPQARRAIMYTPMDLANKSMQVIRQDLERIANEYGSCDVVAADIEADTSDERIRAFIKMCDEISGQTR